MTDTSTQPTAPSPGISSGNSLENSLNTVLKTAPELSQSPGLAVGVATSGGDTQVRSQSIARTTNALSDSDANTRVSKSAGGDISDALDWFGNSVTHVAQDVGGDLEHGGETVLKDVGSVVNKPLNEVQHEYRYLHDVEARHGALPALLEGAGLAAGAAAGFVAGGPQAAILGAEAVGAAEATVFYKDSWQRTASASYEDPHTHQPVSLGRDVASVLGLKPGSIDFKIGSGVIDGIADMVLDPLSAGGSLVGEAKSAEGAQGLLAARFGGTAPKTIGEAIGAEAPVDGEDIERIYRQYRSVRRAFADIAQKSAGEIAGTPAYRSLKALYSALGAARTPEEVGQVFKDAFRTHEMAFSSQLPTLSWTRATFGQPLREWAGNYEGPLAENALVGPARWSRRLEALPVSFDAAAKALTDKDFDPSDPLDDGTQGIYQMQRYSESRRTAAAVADRYLNAPDLESKMQVYRNTTLDMLFSMGGFRGLSRDEYLSAMFDDPQAKRAMGKAIDDALAGGMFGREAVYGMDDDGRILSLVRNKDGTWSYGAAITDNQTGRLKFVSLTDARHAAKVLAKGHDVGLGADQWLYDTVTQGVFKPLVLMTPSYAMHISLAELIPNALRLGVHNLVRSGIAENVAKLGAKFMDHENALERVDSAADELERATRAGDADRISRASARLDAAKQAATKAGYASHLDQAISGVIWRMLDKTSRGQLADLVDDPAALAKSAIGKRIQLMARRIEHEDGAFVEPGLSTGHNYQGEIAPREVNSVSLMGHAAGNAGAKTSKVFGIFHQGQEQYMNAWQAWLKELANDEKTRLAAKELIEGAKSGGERVDRSVVEETPLAKDELEHLHNGMGPRYTRPLYRETNVEGARTILLDAESSLGGASPLDVATHQHLALGQGENRGVHLELDKGTSDVRLATSKPSAGFVDQSRAAELTARGVRGADIRAITIDAGTPDANLLEADLQRAGYLRFGDRWVRPDLAPAGAMSLDEASGRAARAVAEWIREQPDEYKARYLRSNPNLKSVDQSGNTYVTSFANGLPAGMDQADDWGKVVVANLRGATRGANGQMNVSLLRYIADADPDFPETTLVHQDELETIPSELRPRQVKGRELVPAAPRGIQTFANWGFRRVLNPMVNFLSRQPIAAAEFEKQWKLLEPSIEAGNLSEDEAFTLAESRTVNEAIRNVHNIHDRTQWTTTMRNWVPFYFAQEQAYRRMGRLLASDPGAFRRYELMISHISDIGTVLQGKNGEGYFVLPGTGWMTQDAARVANTLFGSIFPVQEATPVGMGWNLSASSVIFPLSSGARPDLGPLVAVPVQAIAELFPEMGAPAMKGAVEGAANAALGPSTASEDIWSQLIPNTIAQRLAVAGGLVDQRSFMSTMMTTILTLDFEHKIPSAGAGYAKWQQFIDRVKNQTRIMYVVKALVGAVTPVSPELSNPIYDKFYGELSNDITKTGSVIKGTQEFLSKNPDATPFTVFESYSPTGETPPDSVQAENWIDDNQSLITKYPSAAFYFMPQDISTKYNATVYNEQLAQGYRVKYDPTANPVGHVGSSFLAQLYIAAGNAFVLDNPENYPAYKSALANETGQQKYQTELNWQAFVAQYSNQNPTWGEWWNMNDKSTERDQAIQNLQSMIKNNEVPDPDSKQSQGIVALMQGYQQYQDQLNAGRQDAYESESESAITEQWDDTVTDIAQRHPYLAPFINGVFVSLPTTGGTGNAQ